MCLFGYEEIRRDFVTGLKTAGIWMLKNKHALLIYKSGFGKAEVSLFANNDMVKDPNTKNIPGIGKLLVCLCIRLAWFEVS